jgi:phage tail tape-measure protein
MPSSWEPGVSTEVAIAVCSILVVGVGSYAGGVYGGKGGEIIGEVIYEDAR